MPRRFFIFFPAGLVAAFRLFFMISSDRFIVQLAPDRHKILFIEGDTEFYQEKGTASALSYLDIHLRGTQPIFIACVKKLKK